MKAPSTRRGFLQGSGAAVAASLFVGFAPNATLAASNASADFNPFVRIGSDGRVAVIVKHVEMGQGPSTGLPTLVAEELGVEMDQVDYEFAPSNPALYNNLSYGPFQGTGGSSSMSNSFMQYRTAGAAAREMLIRAAAESWGVSPESLALERGRVTGAGRSAPISALVAVASGLGAPAKPKLKPISAFKLIGKEGVARLDSAIKSNGEAKFGMDLHLPGHMVVVIARAPSRGGLATGFNASEARKVKGFINAAVLPNKAGIAVYAENTWAAFKAREALQVRWDLSNAESRSSKDIREEIMTALDAEPEFNILASEPSGMSGAKTVLEKIFYFPLLAHAPMEPLNCTIEATADGGIRLHDGCQLPSGVHAALAQVLRLPMEKIEINTLLTGGSFGRRATPNADYQVEAALAFAMTDRSRPIKLVWSREDDLRGGFYRPAFGHKVRVGLDAAGKIVGWDH
ncbi:MAG: molybdopterin cofactor-binding domain-containing protein, partial [Pseudomonadota bacterium]